MMHNDLSRTRTVQLPPDALPGTLVWVRRRPAGRCPGGWYRGYLETLRQSSNAREGGYLIAMVRLDFDGEVYRVRAAGVRMQTPLHPHALEILQ